MSRVWHAPVLKQTALGLLGILAFLSLWQAACTWRLVDPVLLPTAEAVFRTFVRNWTEPTFVQSAYAMQLVVTVQRMLLGLALACVAGVLIGVLIGWSEWLASRLDLTLTLVRYLPPAVMVPVVLLFFGKSDATVLSVIVFGAFWPVLLNTIDGVRGADPLLVEVARIYRFRPLDIAWKIILPMALPQIVVGMRLAVSVSLLATVVGEMLGGTDGLGYLILIAQRTFEYRDMYSGILVLGILGIVANGLFRLLERHVLHWHPVGRQLDSV